MELILQIAQENYVRQEYGETLEIIRARCQVCSRVITECRILGGSSGHRVLKRTLEENTLMGTDTTVGPAGCIFKNHLMVTIF